MSRLFGRSAEVYNTSKYLEESNIPKYKPDKSKTTWLDVQNSPSKIELYLPDTAIKIIEKTPIRIVSSPLVFKEASILPVHEGEEPTLFFPRITPIEEYKQELVFFIGTVLSIYSPDLLPKNFDIPCEYGDVLSLLLEYLYLKEVDKEDTFCLKHLNELLYNAKHYTKSYENYYANQRAMEFNRFAFITSNEQKQIDSHYQKQEQLFLKSTLQSLVPMASMEAVLQLIDNVKSTEDIRNLLEQLIINPNNDRQTILNDFGVDSYGFKKLRKEIEKRGN